MLEVGGFFNSNFIDIKECSDTALFSSVLLLKRGLESLRSRLSANKVVVCIMIVNGLRSGNQSKGGVSTGDQG